jgi:hypothetical protein
MGANKYAANEAYDEYKQRRENNCFFFISTTVTNYNKKEKTQKQEGLDNPK